MLKDSAFDETKIVPYVLFPLDLRWLYYETDNKLLNRSRPDLWKNLTKNEFLVAVPEPRKYSEIRPLLLSSAFDLHLHDRGSVAFPVEVEQSSSESVPLFESSTRAPSRISNLAGNVWSVLKAAWSLRGDLSGADARKLGRQIAALCIAVCHSPGYEAEHKEALAHDWAHVPIPKDRDLFLNLAAVGASVGALLNPLSSVAKLIKETLGDALKTLAVPHSTAGTLRPSDLTVEYSFFGAAAGGWRQRPAEPGELLHSALGDSTGDLFINERVCLRNVPPRIWQYELGGYPVIKKWLGYRDRGRRGDQPLSIQEMNYLRNMVHRNAALLVLHSGLDQLYEAASKDSFTTDEFTQSNSSPPSAGQTPLTRS